MNQFSLTAALKLALSTLLTAGLLFPAAAEAKVACEAEARKLVLGTATFKLRDGEVDQSKLEAFALVVSQINRSLKTTPIPKSFTVLAGTYGGNVAGHRLMAISQKEIADQSPIPLQVWIHEYGHVLFMESLGAIVRTLAENSDVLAVLNKSVFHVIRFYEQGADNASFRYSRALELSGDYDASAQVLQEALDCDPRFEHRCNILSRALRPSTPKDQGHEIVMLSEHYQEMIADLLAEIAVPSQESLFKDFRQFDPREITSAEQEQYDFAQKNRYNISFHARRHVAAKLATLTRPADRWKYFEKIFTAFLTDLKKRMNEPDVETSLYEENRRMLYLVQDLN